MIKVGKLKIFPWGNTLHPQHGPQTWPWWRLFSVSVVRAGVHPPSSGWNIWVYSRLGAKCLYVAIDRRPSLSS